jgi:microcystin degradation protein MlrC
MSRITLAVARHRTPRAFCARLIDAGADKAILALMDDPQAAARAHEAGPGATIETTLGGRSGCAGDAPLHARFEVIALSDGTVPFEGEVYRGGTAQKCVRLGPGGPLNVPAATPNVGKAAITV